MNPRTADTAKRSRSGATAIESEPVVQRPCCGAETVPPPIAAPGAEATGQETASTATHGCCVETAERDATADRLREGDDQVRCEARRDAESSSRHECIAAEAYRIAAGRGFAPGAELDDWLAAEAAVDQRLAGHRPAGRS